MYEGLIQNLRSVDEYDTGYAKLIYDAADAIEEWQAAEKKFLANISALETENQHLKREREWIPVTERLPEPGWYLVRCNEMLKHIHRIAYYYNHAWYENSNNITKFVTHWMPLPEPPKEET